MKPDKPGNPRPHWRTSNAGPAQAEDIISAMQERPSSSSPAFSTHFRKTTHSALRLANALGCSLTEESQVDVSHRVISLTHERQIHLFGIRMMTMRHRSVFFMHHIMEAKSNAPDVILVLAHGKHTLKNLCRPVAFTQAVNRMLAHPEQPTGENCGSCRHYRRWNQTENQGHCTATTPEVYSDCPQQ